MAQVSIKSKTAVTGFFALSVARVSLAFIFLWAFFDKLFGLGFSTCRDKMTDAINVGCSQSWLHGGSPTSGFLTHGTQGPFASWYQSLAGQTWVDWLFMLGLLGIGLGLLTGFMLRLSAFFGSVLLLMMWSAALWPATNPVLDEHIVYIFMLITVASFARYQKLSCAGWWQKMPFVRKMPWLV